MRLRVPLAAVLLTLATAALAFTFSAASATTPGLFRSGERRIVLPAAPPARIELGVRSNWGTTTCAGVTYDCSVADLDNSLELGPADLSVWLDLYFAGPPYGSLGDFDGNGELNPNDLSIWLCLFFQCPPK